MCGPVRTNFWMHVNYRMFHRASMGHHCTQHKFGAIHTSDTTTGKVTNRAFYPPNPRKSIVDTCPIPVPTPDGCVDRVCEKGHGSMMFTDDIVLCGDDETDMTEYLETWRSALRDRWLRISRRKTQFVAFKFGRIG